MITHYLKIAIRNLWKNKGFTLIKISGLALGMAACLLLLEYVSFELSYDDFHENGDRIFRVINDRFKSGERVQKGMITYPTVGPQMVADYPEVIRSTRVVPTFNVHVRTPDHEIFKEERAIFIDSTFFRLFSFPLLAGDSSRLMREPNTLVLSERLAQKFFGVASGRYDEVIGATLWVDSYDDPFTVQAIAKNLPDNSHLQYGLFISYPTAARYWGEGVLNSWQWSDFYHYVELAPGVDARDLEEKFVEFSRRHFDGERVSGAEERFYLQPLEEAHLHSADLEYEIGVTRNGRTVWALLWIAVFVLLIAWMNYINLTTVSAVERSQEVGVRKVMGAQHSQLVRQFLTEALLINGIALVIALQLAQISQAFIRHHFGVDLSLRYLVSAGDETASLLMLAAGLFALGIFASGYYPAFLLSRFDIVQVLKGKFSKNHSGNWLRTGLVVFQFTASIALMSGTWLVYQQINYMNKQELGVAVDQTLVVEGPALTEWDSTFIDRMISFEEALMQIPGVASAGASNRVPGMGTGRIFALEPVGASDGRTYSTSFIQADLNYAETYELEPVAGRNFRRGDHNTDPNKVNAVMLNVSAVRHFGFETPEQALQRKVKFWDKEWEIVGVLPDFHQRSLHHAIEPMVFVPFYDETHFLSVKVDRADPGRLIASVHDLYDQFFPGNAFNYFFLDDFFQRQYEAERQFGSILMLFTILAIVIACLGLFGLASYTTLLRTKEIGIRKVLGASVSRVVLLLSKDFLRLVLIAALIAVPIAWYGVSMWLEDFAYQVSFSGWTFLIVGAAALLIALLTVVFQSVKAALANPAECLRSE
jgi:putative ABC transport system permease protein